MTDDGSRSRDKKAGAGWLAELFHNEHSRLARLVRFRVHDGEAAADLLQEAFVRLLSTATVDTPKRPAAYLQRVVRNLVIDRARRSRHERMFIPLDDCELPPLAPEQEQLVAVDDLMKRYRKAVDALTPRTRQVFLLHRVDELTYAEIARRLGISVATVEYHMSRALVHLDEMLGE